MKTWMQLPLALAMVGALACDRSDRTAGTGTVGTSGTGDRKVDRDFVEDQLAAGDAEVELGRLAQERAASARVREFATMMVREHRKAGEELKQIATRHNIRPDADASKDRDDVRERLAKLSGDEFDREYMDVMVDDHEKAVDALENKANDSDDAQLKQWAASTLSAVKKHLESAKHIQGDLGKSPARTRNQGER